MWAERRWEMNALDKDIHWQQSYCIQQSVDFGRRGGRAHEVIKKVKADFEKVAKDMRKLKTRPDDEELKEPYELYKQSVIGDVDTECPGLLNLKGKAKWEAWNLNKGLSKADAMSACISKAKELIEKYGI
ncbi:acyl-CoA-binding domain-containing protein 7 [Orcinus orca]|uniref:acyl-CoA-binding domain-containing protein 7 n=1 Tax=Orcinus orca TaxID=9733 RepID=UPI0002BCEFF2|nr:acyl-CoA-binding domain-containing protein 7 [Orcinus orca]